MNKENQPTRLTEAFKIGWDNGLEFNGIVKARNRNVIALLRKLRFERDISQSDLCTATGINRINYAGYETEKAMPNIETLVRLADFYGVSLDYICGRTGDPNIYYKQPENEQSSESMEDRLASLERIVAEMQKQGDSQA